LFITDRHLADDRLQVACPVPNEQKMNFPAGPPMAKPASNGHLLPHIVVNLVDIDHCHGCELLPDCINCRLSDFLKLIQEASPRIGWQVIFLSFLTDIGGTMENDLRGSLWHQL
jgi:hypothetical protein